MLPCLPNFDDAYGLGDADFRGVRLVAFCGVSGAGKSTAIDYLRWQHRDFADQPSEVVTTSEAAKLRDVRGRLIVVEELRTPRDLGAIWTLLRGGATVLAASHLAPAWLAPFRLLAPVRCYAIDRDWRKIARFLDRAGVEHSTDAVRAYCRRYGANYVDAQVILERFPAMRFDDALAGFQRFCRLETSPNTDGDGCQTARLD